jgi:hypothetical protein
LHPQVQPTAWTLIGAAIIIVAICYANSVPNGFILDDYQIVKVNPAIRTIAPLQFLKTAYWGNESRAGIYRPFTVLSFALEYPLWHGWAGGYRLTNLLLHTINGLLLFLIARAMLQSSAAACVASAIYLAHPVHTEPVVGLVGRSELLAAMFFLIAWILFRQHKTVFCAIAFALALLSKENAIAFPAVMVLDVLFSEPSVYALKLEWKRLSTLAGVAVLYLYVRFLVLGSVGVPKINQYLDGQMTFSQRELTSARAFLKYFQLLIAPIDVTGDYDFNSIPVADIKDWTAWLGVGAIALTFVFALWIWKRQPMLSFAGLFFYLTMLPTSNWIMPTSLVMSERALYLPSFGICLIAGLLWTKISNHRIRNLTAVGAMMLAGVLCIAHNYIWRDELTYFGNLVRVFPENIRGRQGYGVALVEAGRLEEGREQFVAGLRIKRNAPLLVGLGDALVRIDRGCGRARPVLLEALTIQPNDPFGRWLLGTCFEGEGRIGEAEAAYRQAVQDTQFPDPKLLSAWGRSLEKTGRVAEAQEAYRRAAVLN